MTPISCESRFHYVDAEYRRKTVKTPVNKIHQLEEKKIWEKTPRKHLNMTNFKKVKGQLCVARGYVCIQVLSYRTLPVYTRN